MRGCGYSLPTRFKKASAVGSPQYPAAISAGIRRGQGPAGIMAERDIVKGWNVGCGRVDLELLSPLVVTAHDADHRQRLEGRDQANRRRRCRGVLKGCIMRAPASFDD